MLSLTDDALAVIAALSRPGLGASARAAPMRTPQAGSGSPALAATDTSMLRSASAGTQTSLQTRKPAWAFKVTVWPGLAEAGAVIWTGSTTAPV